MTSSNLGEEDLYNRVKGMQKEYGPYQISFSVCQDVFRQLNRWSSAQIEPVHLREQNDGLGPIAAPIATMIRLHKDGEVCNDLQDYISPLYESIQSPYSSRSSKASSLLRILYRYFPESMQSGRTIIAREWGPSSNGDGKAMD